jgi:hypothetical protein
MKPSIQLDPNSARAFSQAVTLMYQNSKKDAKDVLMLGGVSFARAGRNMTPSARRGSKREVMNESRSDETNGIRHSLEMRWGVKIYKQLGPPYTLWIARAKSRADILREPVARVPHVGLAKMSWNFALSNLGKTMRKMGPQLSSAVFEGSESAPVLHIQNKLSYLLKIAPGVEAEALRKAAKDIMIRLEHKLKKSWGKAA